MAALAACNGSRMLETKAWTITTYGQYVLPRFVYAAFKEANGTIHAVYFDDIIYDPDPPAGTITVGDSVPTQASAVTAAAGNADSAALRAFTVGSTTYVRQLSGASLDSPMALLSAQAGNSVDVYVTAHDDNSGINEMQLSDKADFNGAAWEAYSALKPWTPTGADGVKTIYVRFRDSAGNVSDPADASFALDREAPTGSIALADPVMGPIPLSRRSI